MNGQETSYFIIDWGTTNFRAFAMNDAGEVLACKEAPLGVLQVESTEFATVLGKLLNEWDLRFAQLPIYMAGMVGSAKGWVNVPYVSTPASAQGLAQQAHQLPLPWGGTGYIFAGVSHSQQINSHRQQINSDAGEQAIYDVMRGEEVQLIGLAQLLNQSDFTAILPGTHSKHAQMQQGKITHFASYLTGEVYALFRQHLLLSKGLPEKSPDDHAAFLQGVHESQTGELTNRLFLGWTHQLFGNLAPAQIADYLSGLLIGVELKQYQAATVNLIGDQQLCQRYRLAAEALGKRSQIFSGNECFLAGMAQLIQALGDRSNATHSK